SQRRLSREIVSGGLSNRTSRAGMNGRKGRFAMMKLQLLSSQCGNACSLKHTPPAMATGLRLPWLRDAAMSCAPVALVIIVIIAASPFGQTCARRFAGLPVSNERLLLA